ncbi:MAG: (Fe-S)-binding protein [Candidatus Methanomethylophilaceae archaeon]|nr:(Fe-S)-binding protein [Candidatus Methanomethylophilaceae archaeon]
MDLLRDEIESLRRKCIGCGKCSKVCPSLKHGGCDPMEIMVGNDEGVVHCIGCGNCSRVCRRSDPFTVMRDLQCLVRGVHVSDAFRKTGYAMLPPDPPSCDDLVPEWTGDGALVMPGCIVKCKAPYVEYATAAAMKAMGMGCSELPGNTCCMHPVQFREMTELDRREYKLSMGSAAEGRDLVTLCAGCSEELQSSGVDATHIIPFLHRHKGSLPKLDRPLKVALEPGCSAAVFAKEMREVAEALGCEVVNRKHGCCGKYSDVSDSLMEERESECKGADVIVVGCPMCLVRYDDRPGGLPTIHVSELVALASGDTSTLERHKIVLKTQ